MIIATHLSSVMGQIIHAPANAGWLRTCLYLLRSPATAEPSVTFLLECNSSVLRHADFLLRKELLATSDNTHHIRGSELVTKLRDAFGIR
jgi:hypothetical protein